MENKPSTTGIIGIIIIIVIIVAAVIAGINRGPSTDTPNPTDTAVEYTLPNFLQNLSITPNQQLSGVVTITGSASGMYFEGSFPVTVTDTGGMPIIQTFATAQGDWMTTDFVPFTTSIDTVTLPNGSYIITFTQDDPSGGESGQPIKTYSMPITVQN